MNVTQRQILNAAIDKLNDMPDDSDPEHAHCEAEDIICEMLRGLNYGGAAEAFELARSRIGFWYA